MEFKSRKGEDNTGGNSRINRNIMEFKYIIGTTKENDIIRINRNIMEFKFIKVKADSTNWSMN